MNGLVPGLEPSNAHTLCPRRRLPLVDAVGGEAAPARSDATGG